MPKTSPRPPPAKINPQPRHNVQPKIEAMFSNEEPRKHPSVLKKLKLAKATANINDFNETKK